MSLPCSMAKPMTPRETMKILFFLFSTIALFAGCAGTSQQGLQWEYTGGPYGQNVSSLMVDEDSPKSLYAGLLNGDLHRSTDEGRTWQKWGSIGRSAVIHQLLQNPEQGDILYAATDAGVMVSSTRGREWHQAGPDTVGRLPCKTIVLDPWKPSVLYVGTCGKGLYKTSDGGATWAPIGAGGDSLLRVGDVYDVRVDPSRPDIVYAAVSGTGIVRSTDAGATWKRLTPEFSPTSSVTTHVAVHGKSGDTMVYSTDTGNIFRSTNEGESWSLCRQGAESGRVLALVADPANSDLLYAGTDGGLFRSTDFGSSWMRVPSLLPVVATSIAVPQDKLTPARYAFGPGVGIQISRDGGNSWSHADENLGGAAITFIAADQNGESVYAATGSAILRFVERSASWEPATSGLTGGDVTSLAFDPDSPLILYAGTRGGMFKSTNSGMEWQPMARNARMAPSFIDTHPWIRTRMIASGDQGIFVSTDKGKSWSEAKPQGNRIFVHALTYTPTNAGIIHAATVGLGVVATSDGGLRWEPARFGLKSDSIMAVTLDDQEQQTYFAWTARGDCFRSTNRGLEWNRYSPPWNVGDKLLIAYDRLQPSSVVALINGKDVYYSPSGGSSWFRVLENESHHDASCLFWSAKSAMLYVGTSDKGVARLSLGPLIRELLDE
jgi:photosystem II stability/assembly factor-like uncharacterized protein